MNSSSILSATATLTNNISTIYVVDKLSDAYHWNAFGKVKITKLYNFRLVRLFHSLHSMRPSLWKSHGFVLQTFACETPAPQRTYSCLRHLIIIYCSKRFANESRFAHGHSKRQVRCSGELKVSIHEQQTTEKPKLHTNISASHINVKK